MLVGIGFGPQGMYFVPLYPNDQGISAVYRVNYDPNKGASSASGSAGQPLDIMLQRGCYACHSLKGTGGTMGPSLDREELVHRIETRLGSPEYVKILKLVDGLDREPFTSFKRARKEVLNAEGLERVRTWIKFRLLTGCGKTLVHGVSEALLG